MIKLVILDWDDVFTKGSTQGYFRCYHEAVVGVGIHLPIEEEEKRIKAKWGKHHREELSELLKEHPHLVDQAVLIYESHLFGDTFVRYISPVPGIVPLLKRLSQKYILAIATGMHPYILKEKVMPAFGIPPVFTTIMTSFDVEDVAKQKPDPYMVTEILRINNIKASDAVLAGDAKGDVTMARGAGVRPIVVLTGHLSLEQAQELRVEDIIPDITHIEKILEKY